MSNSGNFGGAPGYGPPNPYVQGVPPLKSSNKAIIIIAILAGVLLMCLAVCGILIALLLPAVQAARDAARRMAESNNLKLIGLALHSYEAEHGALPAAYTVDAEGRPLLSWRVALMPYLESSSGFERVDFNKPWDSPENAFLMDVMPPAFESPRAADAQRGHTIFHTIEKSADPAAGEVGQSLLQPGEWTGFTAVSDGLANTIAVVALPEVSVPWTKPGGLSPEEAYQAYSTGRGINTLMADGSVQYLAPTLDRQTFEDLVTRDGGESTFGL